MFHELQTNTTAVAFAVASFPGELSVGVLVEAVAVIPAQAPDPDPPQTLSRAHDLDQENPGIPFFFFNSPFGERCSCSSISAPTEQS